MSSFNDGVSFTLITGNCKKCKKCQEVERKLKNTCAEPHLFVLHSSRALFHTKGNPSKKRDKKELLHNVGKIATALRNSIGGIITLHLQDLNEADRSLEEVDEAIGRTFSELIEDGALFVDSFVRNWLSDKPGFELYKDFLFVTVTKTNCITTTYFNTKIRTDFENHQPTALSIAAILSKTSYEPTSPPKIRGIDLRHLYEDRHVELKTYKPKPQQLSLHQEDETELTRYIWNDLKLKDNITSLSKVKGGGSYYVGISEETKSFEHYDGKKPIIQGFEITADFRHKLIKLFSETVQSGIIVLGINGKFTDAPSDLYEVAFHGVDGTDPKKYVLEVAVRYVDGVVFYDQGPTSYVINCKGVIQRMDRSVWLQRMQQKCPSWHEYE